MTPIEEKISKLSTKATSLFIPMEKECEVVAPCFFITHKLFQGWFAHFNERNSIEQDYSARIFEAPDLDSLLDEMGQWLVSEEQSFEDDRITIVNSTGFGD